MKAYHPLYYAFFHHYHQKEYWEAHEVLEELWQTQRDNDFYHGLIQIAAIMHQFTKGKVRGARKLAITAQKYLAPYAPKQQEVDVQVILDWLEHCLTVLPTKVERLDPEDFAKLNLPCCPLPLFRD